MNVKIFFTSIKILPNAKVVPETASEFCFGFPSLPLVDFLQSPSLFGGRKNPHKFTRHKRLSKLFSGPQATSGTISRIIGSFLKAM
jgi:hypothetical protein